MKTLIADAQVVADGRVRRGSLLVDADGRIGRVVEDGEPKPSADCVVDASELFLLPGAIDAHVHFREPGFTHKADMASESAAALLGGVTSVMDMPNTSPQTTTIAAWEEKMALGGRKMLTNYAFYLGATNDNLAELLRADYSRVCAVKLFMGSSTGNMLVDDGRALEAIFAEVPALVAAHCESEASICAEAAKARDEYGDGVPWAAHARIRSAGACFESSSAAAQLARRHAKRLHILHITTRQELDLLDPADLPGRLVTGEACPAHLWFGCADYDRLGPLIKCNPAVKSPDDRDALRRAVASGRITTIGTDHAPHTLDEKRGHPYWQTPSGMPMIEHSLPLMLRLADEGWWDYPTVARRMAEDVADLYGVAGRGRLREGWWADLVLVRRRERVVDSAAYKCGWTPLRGVRLNHSVEQVYVNGRRVVEGGEVVGNGAMPLEFVLR